MSKTTTLVVVPVPEPPPPTPRDPHLILAWTEIKAFGRAIIALDIAPVDEAVAVLWYRHYVPGASPERRGHELLLDLEEFGIRASGKVEVVALLNELYRHGDVAMRQRGNDAYFYVDPRALVRLDTTYAPLANSPRIAMTHDLLRPLRVEGPESKYLSQLENQINVNYEEKCFDSCAVMCRRLIEFLIIRVFSHRGCRAAIETAQGQLQPLGQILAVAKSGNHFNLQRNTSNVLDAVKAAGDKGSHDQYYIVEKPDIDRFKADFAPVVAELLTLGGFRVKP